MKYLKISYNLKTIYLKIVKMNKKERRAIQFSKCVNLSCFSYWRTPVRIQLHETRGFRASLFLFKNRNDNNKHSFRKFDPGLFLITLSFWAGITFKSHWYTKFKITLPFFQHVRVRVNSGLVVWRPSGHRSAELPVAGGRQRWGGGLLWACQITQGEVRQER